MDPVEIRQGFLCPICLNDLGDLTRLQNHVATHEVDDKDDVIDQVKGFFDKARRRFRQLEMSPFNGSESTHCRVWKQQQIGQLRRHTEYFRSERDTHVNHVAVDTNKLIIRLDKLISDRHQNGVHRKYKLTNPAFAARHHQLDTAISDAKPTEEQSACSDSPARRRTVQLWSTLTGKKCLSIIDSCQNKSDSDDQLRICTRCRVLLDKRDQMMDRRASSPLAVQMYDRLMALISNASNVFPSYCRMAESLQNGESMYSLESACQLRAKLVGLHEQIDFVSKKLALLDCEESEPNVRQMLVQSNIRLFAASFLRRMLLRLPSLPSSSDYDRLQTERRQIRGQTDNTFGYQSIIEYPQQTESTSSFVTRPIDQGWTADPTSLAPIFHYNPVEAEQSIDPLPQQILIIKGYLKQAAEAGRIEEVHILEQNLRELEMEMTTQFD